MAEKKAIKRFYWHCHHNILVEYVYDYQERVNYIKQEKPANEIDTRLRLFKPVKGELPKAYAKACKAYAKVPKACKAYAKVRKAYDKVRKAYDKAYDKVYKVREAHDKAREAHDKAYDKAREAHDKAYEAHDKAYEAYNKAYIENMPAILALHAIECPNCSWDGKKIKF